MKKKEEEESMIGVLNFKIKIFETLWEKLVLRHRYVMDGREDLFLYKGASCYLNFVRGG